MEHCIALELATWARVIEKQRPSWTTWRSLPGVISSFGYQGKRLIRATSIVSVCDVLKKSANTRQLLVLARTCSGAFLEQVITTMVDTSLGDRPMYNICPVFFRPPEPVYCIPKRLLSALEQDVLLPHTDYIFNRLYLQQVDYLQQIIFNRLYLQQIIFNR